MQLLLRIALFAALVIASPSACKTRTGGEAEQPAADGEAPASAQDSVDPTKLVAQLEGEGTDPKERLEAIHRAREARVTEAIPALRALLVSGDPEIVVAAAAALQGLEAKDIGTDVVEAAGRLSRERQYEHLRQLLFVIGDIGGPAARTYLEAVADGHQVPPIRQTAGQVLERMN